jgi:hypothetical protein
MAVELILRCLCYFLGDLVELRVEPVAAWCDGRPAAVEAGQRDARAHAAGVRAQLARLSAGKNEGAAETYASARALLANLWAAAVEDLQGAAPARVDRARSRGPSAQ